MLFAYLNYPNASVTVHRDRSCGHIRSRRKEGQRTLLITLDTLSGELRRFEAREHVFGASADINDMWVDIDCSDEDFESAILSYLHRTLGKRYKRLREAGVYVCRCAK